MKECKSGREKKVPRQRERERERGRVEREIESKRDEHDDNHKPQSATCATHAPRQNDTATRLDARQNLIQPRLVFAQSMPFIENDKVRAGITE